jgi:hypothetical protein
MADFPAIGAAILCGVVLTRWLRARDRAKSLADEPMTEPPEAASEADMQVAFSCAGCGQTAGRVQLLLPGELATGPSRPAPELLRDLEPILSPWAGNPTTLVVTTFFGVQSQPVPGQRIDCVAQAIRWTRRVGALQTGIQLRPIPLPGLQIVLLRRALEMEQL